MNRATKLNRASRQVFLFVATLAIARVSFAQSVQPQPISGRVAPQRVDAGLLNQPEPAAQEVVTRMLRVTVNGPSTMIDGGCNDAGVSDARVCTAVTATTNPVTVSPSNPFNVHVDNTVVSPIPVFESQCLSFSNSTCVVEGDADGGQAVDGGQGCPAVQLANRRWMDMCNSLGNDAGTGSAALIKIDPTGTPVDMAVTSPGDTLGRGDCIRYNQGSSVIPKVNATSGGGVLTVNQCAY